VAGLLVLNCRIEIKCQWVYLVVVTSVPTVRSCMAMTLTSATDSPLTDIAQVYSLFGISSESSPLP
jgi:hypothetical protein